MASSDVLQWDDLHTAGFDTKSTRARKTVFSALLRKLREHQGQLNWNCSLRTYVYVLQAVKQHVETRPSIIFRHEPYWCVCVCVSSP